MKFPKRNLESIIKSICKKNNIKYDLIGQGFIFKLTKKNKTQFVYGYNFPCNNVCASKICDDKAATSEILKKNKISTFEHTFYMRGFFTKEEILKTFKKFNNNVVVKPNNGTGGKNVIHCVTFPSLLKAIDTILNSGINFSISPFYDYEHEYRIIVYKKKNMIFYCKNRVDD
jgi:glutathione synthase/RimK-type ligase-like ATP-grasp enzyme